MVKGAIGILLFLTIIILSIHSNENRNESGINDNTEDELFYITAVDNLNDSNLCSVWINEINFDDPIKQLKQDCRGRPMIKSLNGHKIILIDHDAKGFAIITLVIDLYDQNFDENNFFVIGGTSVDEANLKCPNELIEFRHQLVTKQWSNMITNGNTLPVAIALLFDEKPININLSPSMPYIYVEPWLEVLKKVTMDMVCFGRRSYSDRCDVFEKIHQDFINRKYVLREFDEPGKRDLSLSRCGVFTIGFMPEVFQLNTPTPGSENLCNGPYFTFEDIINEITPSLIQIPSNSNPNTCSSDIQPATYESMITEMVESEINDAMEVSQTEQCSSTMFLRETNSQINTLEVDFIRLQSMKYPEEKEWDTVKYFRPEWIDHMQKYYSNVMPRRSFNTKRNWMNWFNYIPEGQTAKYNCWLCTKYYDEFALKSSGKDCINSLDACEINDQYDRNYDKIRRHYGSKSHCAVIKILANQKFNTVQQDFIYAQNNIPEADKIYEATSNMFRTVYTSVVANIPFNNHHHIVKLQQVNGFNLGHYFANLRGASRMADTIGIVMLKTLTDYLNNNKYPISLIVDASDAGDHFMSILFQTIENERTVIYFYRLIQITGDATGLNLFNALYNAFQLDGITLYMKENLRGIACNGGSNFAGSKIGLVAYLKTFANHPIFRIHCMAHRLELAFYHASTPSKVQYYSKFEEIMNGIYKFYENQGNKRLNELKQIADNLGEKIYKLNYIHKIRWMSSSLTAVLKIKKMYKVIVRSLDEISKDTKQFPQPDVRARALKFYQSFTDKNFVMILHFVIDVLQALSRYSLAFQQKGGLLIGKSDLINKMINAVIKLKTENGQAVNTLLEEASCEGLTKCTAEAFIDPRVKVIWEETELKLTLEIQTLSLFRLQFMSNLVVQLESYFPDSIINNFNIFEPKNIPRNPDSFSNYGQTEIIEISNFFGLNTNEIKIEWPLLLKAAYSDQDTWCKIQNQEARVFWPTLLNNIPLTVPQPIRTLIRIVLFLPIGSADVERSFSILHHIYSPIRNRLSPDTLNTFMFIRMNGPKDISKFKAIGYAKYWVNVQKNTRVDDPVGHVEKTEYDYVKEKNFDYFDESALF